MYFHILETRELEQLRGPVELLARHRSHILEEWYELYRRHFPEGPASSPEALDTLYAVDLDEMFEAMLELDMDRFAAAERTLGEHLAGQVTFAEIVAMLHLFEESCARVLERHTRGKVDAGVYLVLDKVSHCRMILLADSYLEARDRVPARRASSPVQPSTGFHGIVGCSAALARIRERIEAAARGAGAVLVAGESGTGKELVARAIHACGGDLRRPFVPVNCAALPPELIESELFGHRKGSFSGAREEYLGLIRAADGGTLFLDEITEMAQPTQAKLLRVLQERLVRPVGSTKEVPVDVRVVASTNRSPKQAVDEGMLRKDLYYRLQTYVITLPPLRERKEDIPGLVAHFVAVCNQRLNRQVEGVHQTAMQVLLDYSWPGNIRELSNVIERAFTFGIGPWISALDLPEDIAGEPSAWSEPALSAERQGSSVRTVAEAEREALAKALEASGGNKVQAAKLLGISRHGLYSRLKKLGLDAG